MVDLSLERTRWSDVPNAAEFVARGQMTAAAVMGFKKTVDDAVAGRASILILGLKDVPFLPSISLSYLAELVARLQRRGGGMSLVQADGKIKVVLASLGLVQFFHFSDDFERGRAWAQERAHELARQPRLVISRGPGEGQEYPIGDDPVVIGSHDDATIQVRAPHIQPRHAEVARSESGCILRDLGSKMGTFVGKKKVASHPLVEGDVIRIVEFELRFVGPGAA